MLLKPLPKLQSPEPQESGSSQIEKPADTPTDTPEKPQVAAEAVSSAIEKHFGPAEDEKSAEQAKPAEEKATEPKAEEKPAETPEDEAPPEGSSERAKDRWGQLTSRVKEYEAKAKEYEAGHQLFQKFEARVQDCGLDAQGLNEMLDMAKAFRSNDPEQLKSAIAYLDGLRNDLAVRTGMALPGTDPLAEHQDLRERVNNMQLTEADALEIAKLRRQSADIARQREQAQQQQMTAQQTNQHAIAAFQSLEAKANQPGHAAKVAYIQQYFQTPGNMEKFVEQYPPQLWAQAVNLMYDMYQPTAATPSPQPLRSATVAVGAAQRKGPMTFNETLTNAISSHFGR